MDPRLVPLHRQQRPVRRRPGDRADHPLEPGPVLGALPGVDANRVPATVTLMLTFMTVPPPRRRLAPHWTLIAEPARECSLLGALLPYVVSGCQELNC